MEQDNELIRIRYEKLNELVKQGVDPYNQKFEVTHTSTEVFENYEELKDAVVAVAGRIISIREHGKACFGHLQDGKGNIQFYLNVDGIGPELFEQFKLCDIGDIIGVKGKVFCTRRGEITIQAQEYFVLAKSLRPLPEKWHGLKDVELRYRQRYLDLIVNKEVKETFILRSKIIQGIRDILNERDFLEVETPMMSTIAGGASARPFRTYHNALDVNLFLRIATELHLKRLLVGEMEKVYELGKVFRNEGISTIHNPEFTSLEIYQTYADYHDMMELTEQLISELCRRLFGEKKIEYEGKVFDLTPPWPRVSMLELVKDYTGVDFNSFEDNQRAHKEAEFLGLETDKNDKWGNILTNAFETFCEDKLEQPIFVKDFPVEVSPLAKTKREDPRFTERFEAFVGGKEIANAFSELNDPLEQRKRFEYQLTLRQKGDEEAHMMDEDFLTSLEYGMPPAGGLGIGVDRLVMFLCGETSIRDVILFPTLKPRD